jgi:hypothetical protein
MEEAKTSQVAVKVYPNPTNGLVSVEIFSSKELKPLEINVIDELGYIVFTQMITDYSSNIYSLNISALKQGVYLLSVKTKNYYSIPCKLILN